MTVPTTTLKLEKKTKARLDALKHYEEESYDRVLQRMLDIIGLCKLRPDLARQKVLDTERIKVLMKRSNATAAPVSSQEKSP